MSHTNPHLNSVSFGSWLKFQLHQTGTKISDLAKYIGVTRTIIYRFLGKTYDPRFTRPALPSPETMTKILEYFDIPNTPDFANFSRTRGWIHARSRKKYKKFLKSEFYPQEDQTFLEKYKKKL